MGRTREQLGGNPDEDLLQGPSRELGRLAGFLGIAARREALSQAVETSSANRLRQLERIEHEEWVTTGNAPMSLLSPGQLRTLGNRR